MELRKLVAVPRIAYASFRVLMDPKRLDEIISIADNLADPVRMQELADGFKARSETARRAFALKPRVGRVDLDALGKLPEGTLGRAFADHCRKAGIDPADLPSRPSPDDPSYIQAHLYETHDIWHVVGDFDTLEAGELGLQAFYLAQFRALLALVILPVGMLHVLLFKLASYDQMVSEIVRGFVLGRRARSLFGVDWASMWERPIAEVRRELGIDLEFAAAVASGEKPVAAALAA